MYDLPMDYLEKVKRVHECGGYGSIGCVGGDKWLAKVLVVFRLPGSAYLHADASVSMFL